jgi:Tfp pilus assembly protein PilF
MGPRQQPNARLGQNFCLVWLDGSIDEINNDDSRRCITQLRQVVNTVNTFINVDECIEFINGLKEKKTFMISSGALGQAIVRAVHDKPQVITIYIFCGNKTHHEKWAKSWSKIEGVYADIAPICEALKKATQDCEPNSVSVSFVKKAETGSHENLDQLDTSFTYTQILKEILLTIDFQPKHMDDFLTYCREEFVGNTAKLQNVDKIEKEYPHPQPIWWYTYKSFLYSMLNEALRKMEVDLIIKMGFFVRDLHNHIAELHAEQCDGDHHSDALTVYLGKGFSQTEFEQLKQKQGGLLPFNNFLLTSQNPDVSLDFARRTMNTSNLVGVLFVMNIDPSISATPFANVAKVSCTQKEEILFSMCSVFRIGQVKQIDKNDRLWQVDLTLIGDNDPQLYALTKRMREETKGSTGWHRLGQLMIKLDQVNKAEELYQTLLNQTNNESEKGYLFYQLGWIKNSQKKYAEAIGFYEKSLGIWQKTLPPNHPDLATSYSNIGSAYGNMREYPKALSYYEKTLGIYEKTLPANHPDLATSYNNIGEVYDHMGEYSKARSYYERALDIWQRSLTSDHPNIKNVRDSIESVKKKL